MYAASPARYSTLPYHRCGKSGLMLPAVSLGLWHNFGDTANFENMRLLCRTAFDNGITHFDLANNYGPEAFKVIYDHLSTHTDGEVYDYCMVSYLLKNTVSENGSAAPRKAKF